jgi:hypothetical protein
MVTPEQHVNMVQSGILALDELMFHLLWCTQRSLEDHYRKHMNVRIDACKMGLQKLYDLPKVQLMYPVSMRARLHPKVPRWLHHRLCYAVRQEDNAGVNLFQYVPSLVQPNWHPVHEELDIPYLPSLATPLGMSRLRVKWLLSQGLQRWDATRCTAVMREYVWAPWVGRPPSPPRDWLYIAETNTRYRQSRTENVPTEWWIRQFLCQTDDAPRNLFLDYIVFCKMLGSEAQAMAAVHELSYATCYRDDDRFYEQLQADQQNFVDDVVRCTLQAVPEKARLQKFFQALKQRWDYSTPVIPTLDDIKLLIHPGDTIEILSQEYKSVDADPQKAPQILKEVESMNSAIAEWREWTECPAEGGIMMLGPTCHVLSWKQLYAQILLRLFEKHIYPALILWHVLMVPDHITYADAHNDAKPWTDQLQAAAVRDTAITTESTSALIHHLRSLLQAPGFLQAFQAYPDILQTIHSLIREESHQFV